jgi:hypothetical protein
VFQAFFNYKHLFRLGAMLFCCLAFLGLVSFVCFMFPPMILVGPNLGSGPHGWRIILIPQEAQNNGNQTTNLCLTLNAEQVNTLDHP